MGIRMSSSQFMYNYNNALQNAYNRQAKLFEDADGSSLHRPSDDSVAYHQLLRFQDNLSENEQYQSNVKNAISWMATSDGAIVHIAEIMKTFNEKSVDASNDHNSETDWDAIGKEMLAEIQEIVATSNTQVGDRYVFSGQHDITKPFVMSESKVNRGLAKTLDNDQVNFFRNSENKSIDAHSTLTQMLTLEDNEGKTYYLDTTNGYIYDKEFMDTGYKDVYTRGQGRYVNPAIDACARLNTTNPDYFNGSELTFKVSDFFNSQGIIKETTTYNNRTDGTTMSFYTVDDGATYNYNGNEYTMSESGGVVTYTQIDDTNNTISITLSDYTVSTNRGTVTVEALNDDFTAASLDFTTIEQYIVSYKGDEKHISMVKLNGVADPSSDTVNLTGQEMYGSDIFDNEDSGNGIFDKDGNYLGASGCAILNEMFTVLAKTQAHDEKWMSSDGVTIADVAHGTLTVGETQLGARHQLYNSVLTMLENQADNITEDITNISSTDVAKLAVKLMEMQTLYNMSLSMGGRVLPQSLADYL